MKRLWHVNAEVCLVSCVFVVCLCLVTGIFDKHLPVVNTCHIVGTVRLYKYWPLFRFPLIVGKCDTRQRTRQCSFMYQAGAFFLFF